ncbi:NmrA family NAD(P)-binding protein [Rhizobium sp. ICMP 5592]|uniref:NmrA family NAD(P)-binding protein n=1 Tax=Rhizobium sp. ICMP 5592 TaxID=2292445 RepID=UPI001296647C|nr:NmrA family NAD(P)-binding protein [Rhizobium sp. ICMP 5592]MQB44960.1 NAD-dependent epimerase/dehydratase family protein [Rhizobium sp. ICMP 5592]
MSAAPILVTGATGKLGQLVVQRLSALGQLVRVFTRRPEIARNLFSSSVQIANGDFGDRTSLGTALAGVDRLFLLSPIGERLADEQIAVVNAAISAGVHRIVKISGSDWTIEPSGSSISGDAHAAVERHLKGLPAEHVSLRPNAWMQVSLANIIKQVLAGNPVSTVNPDAGIGYIDARDIADIAVHQLLADTIAGEKLVLSGPRVVTARQIAALLSPALKRPVEVTDRPRLATSSDDDFEHRAVAQFMTLIAAGRAAGTTDIVATLLGNPPRSVEAFIGEYLATEAALAG